MFSSVNDLTVTDIEIAVFVPAGAGDAIHKNRRFHGLVLNDSASHKYYHFQNGQVLETPPGALFYLPQGSSYKVEAICPGGCYAINFYLDKPIHTKPFSINLRDTSALLRLFKASCDAWEKKKPLCRLEIMKNLYSVIHIMANESLRSYTPSAIHKKLLPAEEKIKKSFTDPDLSVYELAELCGVSAAYFRKIFSKVHQQSPKDYICSLRIDKAKAMLAGGFSVSDTAFACGYTDPCYFSREFKRKTGIPPSEYK